MLQISHSSNLQLEHWTRLRSSLWRSRLLCEVSDQLKQLVTTWKCPDAGTRHGAAAAQLVLIGRDSRQTALILVTTVSVFSADLSRQPNYTSSCISCIAHASCVHCHTCRHTGVPGHVYFLPAGSVRMCPMPILHLSRFVILPIIYIAKAVRLGPSKDASGSMISLGRIICAELWQTKLETRTLFVMREKMLMSMIIKYCEHCHWSRDENVR